MTASAIDMIRELRDQLEFRISQTEDFRALMALNRELDTLERRGEDTPGSTPVALAPPPARVEPLGFPPDFDPDEWAPAPEPKRWWRRG